MGFLQVIFTFLSKRIMSCFSLITIIIIVPQIGLGRERIGACLCDGNDCRTVIRGALNFKTAERVCRDRNGELMTVRSKESENIIEDLLEGTAGNFWIGLRLPDGRCSDLSSPLRGYEWTAGSSAHIPSFINWKNGVQVCSPQCVSLSNNQQWAERPCWDKVDGFMCEKFQQFTCQTPQMEARALSDPSVFKSTEDWTCSDAPCEHKCTEVEGGYKCSCFPGYIPSSQDLHMCILHCSQKKCPIRCDRNTHDCFCPEGYVRSDNFCEDINECEMQEQCEHFCNNTLGSFVCSCRDRFILENEVNCVRIDLPPTTPAFTPDVNNTRKVSSATTSSIMWVLAVIAVVVILLIFVARYCLTKLHEQIAPSSHHQYIGDVENIEC